MQASFCQANYILLWLVHSIMLPKRHLSLANITQGSSNGRGPRCAGWMQDYIDEAGGELQALVMRGGIKGFVKSYGGRLMDSYDEKAWEAS